MAIQDCNLYKYIYLSEKGYVGYYQLVRIRTNASDDVIGFLARNDRSAMVYLLGYLFIYINIGKHI